MSLVVKHPERNTSCQGRARVAAELPEFGPDGRPWALRHEGTKVPPTCGRCGVEWALDHFAEMVPSPVTGFTNADGGILVFAPQCDCWRIGRAP